MAKTAGVRSAWHSLADLGLFLGLAVALGCGVNIGRKAPLGSVSSKDGPGEFANPQWIQVKSGAPSVIYFPPAEINFKKLADRFPEAQIQQGDQIWMGVNRRHALSDPPLGAWRPVDSVGDPNGDIFQPLGVGRSTGVVLERGHEYVLALKITRGTGPQSSLVHQVLNVAPFLLDDRSVITTAMGSSYREVNQDKPLGLVHKHPAFPFRGACLFRDHLGVVTEPRPGDRAFVTYMGVQISLPTLVQGALKNEFDAYELDVFANTLSLQEHTGAAKGAGLVEFHCETSSGKSSKQTLAVGVDYTPPALSLDDSVDSVLGPSIRKLSIDKPIQFVGSCFGGGNVEVAIVPWDVTAKDDLEGTTISQGFVIENLAGYDNDCSSDVPGVQNKSQNLGYQISLSPQNSLPSRTYAVRLRTLDAAGNSSQVGLPFVLTAPQVAE